MNIILGNSAADLEPYEAAILIGLSNNPSAYDPVNKPEAALKKRNEVLKKMYDEQVITQKQYDSSVKEDQDPAVDQRRYE